MLDVDDLEAQKKLWGRDGHGIPGANPNYAGRVGIVAAAGVLIVGAGAFALLTGGHTQTKTATRYIADVAKDELMQSRLEVSLHERPAKSVTIVHELVQTLLKEDRRLSTQKWPIRVEFDVQSLVTYNQQQISVLNKYAPASSSARSALLKQQTNDAYQADFYDTQIRALLDANPVGS
jgi:hypothetical protein